MFRRTDSKYLASVKQWMADGTKSQDLSARATSIEVLPDAIHLATPDDSHRILVRAHYRDGSERDVTHEAVISSNNTELLEAKHTRIKDARRADAADRVRYK